VLTSSPPLAKADPEGKYPQSTVDLALSAVTYGCQMSAFEEPPKDLEEKLKTKHSDVDASPMFYLNVNSELLRCRAELLTRFGAGMEESSFKELVSELLDTSPLFVSIWDIHCKKGCDNIVGSFLGVASDAYSAIALKIEDEDVARMSLKSAALQNVPDIFFAKFDCLAAKLSKAVQGALRVAEHHPNSGSFVNVMLHTKAYARLEACTPILKESKQLSAKIFGPIVEEFDVNNEGHILALCNACRILCYFQTSTTCMAFIWESIIMKSQLFDHSADISQVMRAWHYSNNQLKATLQSPSYSEEQLGPFYAVSSKIGEVTTLMMDFHKRLQGTIVTRAIEALEGKIKVLKSATPNWSSFINDTGFKEHLCKNRILEDGAVGQIQTRIAEMDATYEKTKALLKDFGVRDIATNQMSKNAHQERDLAKDLGLTCVSIKGALNLLFNHTKNPDLQSYCDSWLSMSKSPGLAVPTSIIQDVFYFQ